MKWERWGGGGPIEQLRRKDVREFLDWVHEQAVNDEGTNPGRTANKARKHLRAVLSWAWEHVYKYEIVVPVQELESWILADDEAITKTISSLSIGIVKQPENIDSPK
jgi:hypothetical protein